MVSSIEKLSTILAMEAVAVSRAMSNQTITESKTITGKKLGKRLIRLNFRSRRKNQSKRKTKPAARPKLFTWLSVM